MRRSRPCTTWFILMLCGSVQAVLPTRGDEPDLASTLDQLVAARRREDGFSGTVLVARNGVPILRRGYGLANREHTVPNTPETKFRLGSLTKQFTAAAILILQEQGKLAVRERIKTYLPGCPETWDEITVHHLLTHTSGIPDYTRFPGYGGSMRERTTPDALIVRFQYRPLEFKPGDGFAYSNSGYALLGRIIEQVSGERYADFLRAALFKPLGMDDSGYDDPTPVQDHRASGYARGPSGTENARFLDMTIPYAAGALYSTVDDLLRWDRALATDRLLSRASKEAMFTPARQGYGYGWRIARVFDRPMVAHAGGINGFATHIRRFPEDGLCIVVLSNVEGTPVVELGNDLAAAVFGKGSGPSKPAEP